MLDLENNSWIDLKYLQDLKCLRVKYNKKKKGAN